MLFIRRTEKHYDGTVELMHYAIPLSMPIFGKYDDYGRIEDIEESPITKKLEEFFGYDIDTIMSDVYDFSIDQWLEPWDKEGRYGQVRDGRAKDPNYTFMKEEFDRYVPKYEHLRDLVTRYNALDKTNEMGEQSFALSLALQMAKENNVSEDAAIEELRKNSWKDIEKKNFNVFWAIDHAALWKAFSAEYDTEDYDEDEDEESAESMMNWLRSYCPVRTDVYDGRYETIPGMNKYVLYVCDEPSMLKEFTKFMRTAY